MELPEAIRKITLFPAQRLEKMCSSMKKRGRLQVGCYADVTVFDFEKITDTATFDRPASRSAGIAHVFVNGVPVIQAGVLDAAARPGKGVKGDSYTAI